MVKIHTPKAGAPISDVLAFVANDNDVFVEDHSAEHKPNMYPYCDLEDVVVFDTAYKQWLAEQTATQSGLKTEEQFMELTGNTKPQPRPKTSYRGRTMWHRLCTGGVLRLGLGKFCLWVGIYQYGRCVCRYTGSLNFGRSVLSCIEYDICNQRIILQHFLSSTRLAHVAAFYKLYKIFIPGYRYSNSGTGIAL